MTFSDRTRGVAGKASEAAANAATTARRQARRAQLEIAHHRLETRIRKAYADLGMAVYPMVETGDIVVEAPGIQTTMDTLAGLLASAKANREEIEKLGGSLPVGEASFPNSES